MFSAGHGSEFERAMKAVEELPFVGLVEVFDESLVRLEKYLASEGMNNISLQSTKQNVTRSTSISLDEKMEGFKEQLGSQFFDKVIQDNKQDMALYELVKSRFS
jgi:hypothetical protein